jgi:hypothetical protein
MRNEGMRPALAYLKIVILDTAKIVARSSAVRASWGEWEGRGKRRSDHPMLWAAGETHSPVSSYLSAYMPLPIEYVPVHVRSSEPSEFSFPVQPPEPLIPLYFPVPLTIFHLLETGLVGSVELDASYVL